MTILLENGTELLESAKLKRRSWGGVDTVCMMSALVPGAQSTDDCETAGWPLWLADLCVGLYDADVGADDEQQAADQWAYRVAEAIAHPVDYDRARHLFFIAVLKRIEHLDTAHVVRPVIELHQRALTTGMPAASEWDSARAAAWDADWVAAGGAAGAAGDAEGAEGAEGAAWAAGAAARGAAWAAEGAAWTVARDAASAVARSANAAAWAAAREDLIDALLASRG